MASAMAAMPSAPPRAAHICPCMLLLLGVGVGVGVKGGLRVGSGAGALLPLLCRCSSSCAVSPDTTCFKVLSAIVANACNSLHCQLPFTDAFTNTVHRLMQRCKQQVYMQVSTGKCNKHGNDVLLTPHYSTM